MSTLLQISRCMKNGLRRDTTRVGGSNPSPLTIIWGQHLGLSSCPYMKRWVLDFGLFSIRLHKWISSDDDRAYHDHPWWFLTTVIYGSYVDISPLGEDNLHMGSIRFRHARHQHTVKIITPNTWTLLITGKPSRRWGFWVKGKLIKRDKYFAVYGHHPCTDGSPIRMSPDGTVITACKE